MVVDHHLPLFDGELHVNPRLSGIDGDRELSAAGTAYYIAQQMGDNRIFEIAIDKKVRICLCD